MFKTHQVVVNGFQGNWIGMPLPLVDKITVEAVLLSQQKSFLIFLIQHLWYLCSHVYIMSVCVCVGAYYVSACVSFCHRKGSHEKRETKIFYNIL